MFLFKKKREDDFFKEEMTSKAKPRPGLFRRFLYFTGGIPVSIVERYPLEQLKYLAVAWSAIVASAVSAVSMFLLLFGALRKNIPVMENGAEILKTRPYSPLGVTGILLGAIIWGCIIFAVNWFIIVSMKKGERFSKNALAVLTKIVIALTMGFMDTVPIQVAFFKDYLPPIKNEMRRQYLEEARLSEDNKIETVEAKNQAAREELLGWETGDPEAINRDPTVIDLRARGAAIQKRDDELRPAYREANNRAWREINTAQSRLSGLRAQIAAFDQNAGERNDELALLQGEAAKLEGEILSRNADIRWREGVLTDLAGQKREVEDQLQTRYQAIDAGRSVIERQLLGEAERTARDLEDTSRNVKNEQRTSSLAGMIYNSDSLASNVIALGVLANTRGSFIESAIGKMVRQTNFLIAVVIMILDLSPVIVLMFLDKGACEVHVEQDKLNAIYRIRAHTEAFQQVYPEMARIAESGKLEMEMRHDQVEMEIKKGELEMQMLQKTADWHMQFFNLTFDTTFKKVMQEIDVLAARAKETGNEDIKKRVAAYIEEMLRQFEETKDKMMLEFRDFLRGCTPPSPRSVGQ